MKESYIQAIILGLLIGGAIILDDFIGPKQQEIKDKAEAEARRLEREAEQETIAKFLNNVESRIYANISKNLVDSMFANDGSTSGTATIEGATIYWVKDTTADTITVTITEEDGSTD